MDFIVFLASIPFKLMTLLRNGHWIKGVYYKSSILLSSGNILRKTGEMMNSSIICNGRENQIEIYNKLMHSEIKIEGNNNLLLFEEGGAISHSNILIRANNARVEIGRDSDLLSVCMICQGEKNYIEIGNDCLFSRDVDIWNSDTHTIFDSEGNIINYSSPVKIGNHVWVGKHVRILKNVTIEDNSVIGMNSLVTKDIPANSIAAGSPAKIVKTGISWSKEMHQLSKLVND